MFYDKTQVSKTNFFFSDLKWIWCGNKAKLTEWARIETFNYWRHFYFSLSFHVAQSNLLSPDKTVPLLCPKNYVTKVNQLDLHQEKSLVCESAQMHWKRIGLLENSCVFTLLVLSHVCVCIVPVHWKFRGWKGWNSQRVLFINISVIRFGHHRRPC